MTHPLLQDFFETRERSFSFFLGLMKTLADKKRSCWRRGRCLLVIIIGCFFAFGLIPFIIIFVMVQLSYTTFYLSHSKSLISSLFVRNQGKGRKKTTTTGIYCAEAKRLTV